jgi:Ca2+-binding EF-hand superfamily protein
MIPSGGGFAGLGGAGHHHHVRQQIFNTLDADQSGGIHESEFVGGLTAQNANVSEDAAKKVFAAFDSDSDGVVSADEFKTGFQRLSSAVRGALIGLQDSSAPPPPPAPPSLDDLFVSSDADGSGDLSEIEFVAGAPDGAHKPSEDELKTLFAALDTDGSGTVSKDEFKAGLQHRRPGDAAGAPPPPQASADDGTGSDSNPLLALLQNSASGGVSQQDLNTLFATLFNLQGNAGVSSVSTTA